MKHFLEKMGSPDWVWAEKYEHTEQEDETMLMQDSVVFFVENETESMLLCVVCTLLYSSWQSVFVTNKLTLRGRVLIEKLMVTQLLKNFPTTLNHQGLMY